MPESLLLGRPAPGRRPPCPLAGRSNWFIFRRMKLDHRKQLRLSTKYAIINSATALACPIQASVRVTPASLFVISRGPRHAHCEDPHPSWTPPPLSPVPKVS